jgi:hypothetical protein
MNPEHTYQPDTIQEYQRREALAVKMLEDLRCDKADDAVQIQMLKKKIAEQAEDLEGLNAQVTYWRGRTAHWMGRARSNA